MHTGFSANLYAAFNRYDFYWPEDSDSAVAEVGTHYVTVVFHGGGRVVGDQLLILHEDWQGPLPSPGERLKRSDFEAAPVLLSETSPLPPTPFTAEGYELLADVLVRAYEQSSAGKGKERHATGLPFHEQPIVRGAKDYGPGGPLFQVGKKSREAFGMIQRGQNDAAVRELLGAIVYAAAAIVALEDEAE